MSGQAPAVSKKHAVIAWLAAILVFFTAWFLFAAALLALSTFLPPWGSHVTLGSVFIVSGVFAFWFSRRAPVRTSLKSLRENSGQTMARSFGLIGRMLLTLAAGSFVVITCTGAVWHGRVLVAKQSLKEKGLPVTLSDLQENLPYEEYAYPTLWKAMKKDFDWEFFKKICYVNGDYICTPETFKKKPGYAAHFAAYLDKKLPSLLSKKYTRYRKVYYAPAPRNPYPIYFPRLYYFVASSRVAGLYAVSLALKGDIAKAWALIGLQFDVADLLSNEKDPTSKLVVSHIRRQAADTALYIMLNRPDAVIPPDLVPHFKRILSDYLVSDALKYELALQFDSYAYLEGVGGREYPSSGVWLYPAMMDWSANPWGDFGLWLEYGVYRLLRSMGMLDINSLAAARYFSALTTKGSWAQLISVNNRISLKNLPLWPYCLVKMLPDYFRLHAEEWELKAWTQLALACSELGRYRMARGRYPKDISELSPESFSVDLLKDVFTGNQLSYVPAADRKSFTLCSLGPDGDKKDRSGKELCVRRKP
ncbi:MAG: hypothetical protein KKH28_06915 [Elusimicrobia bacterium]|nr:hypothetical protein [Elusimicrobiota bacterium]